MSNIQKNNKPNVPNLRFPEFSGEWEKIRVSDLLEFFSTNSLSWDQLEYGGTDIFNLHYGLIHSGLSTQISLKKSILPSVKSEYRPRNYTLCEDGDVAFADASEDTNEVGKVVEFVDCAGKEIVCGLHTIHGRDKLGKTVVGFKGYAFSSPAFHNQIRRIAQGTKIFSINTGNFAEIFIGVPQKEEQDKISHLLSLLDQRIAIQNRIIEDLKKLKTALCELLYDESEHNCLIGDLVEQISIRNKQGESFKILSVSNQLGFVEQSEQFEGRTIASQDTSNYKIVSLNDFAYNPARINVGSIAKLKVIEKGIVSPMYVCFRCKDGVLPDYLETFFDTQYFFLEMEKRLEGSVRMCLSFEGLSDIPINLPSLMEQQAIAYRISTLSQKIEIEMKILKKFIQQKKYVLSNVLI